MSVKSPQSLRLVVLVSGRGSNLGALIRATQNGDLKSKIVGVISNRAEAFALSRAQEAGIPTRLVPSKGLNREVFEQKLAEDIAAFSPDLIVLAGFMKILPPKLTQAYPRRIINIHPSLLPAFPGLRAQQQALEAKASISGCTVHFVDDGCDTGPIILQKSVPILPDDTEETLSQRILKEEHTALVETVALIESGKVR